MIGTQFRWFVRRRRITTAMVTEYRDKYSVSMMTAKKELESSNAGQVLQYRTWFSKWHDIPYIVEYFE